MKRILACCLAASLSTAGFTLPAYATDDNAEDRIILYVSTDGSDDNTGDENSPLLTMDGARKKLREIREENTSIGAEIIFKEGTYRITKGIKFDALDSGSEDARVIYRADDGAKVTFKGSVEIDAAKGVPVTDEKVKARFYPEVQERIVEFDLKKQNFTYAIDDLNNVKYYYSLLGQSAEREYFDLYLNGKEQMLAQWPNGDDTYTNWVEPLVKGSSEGGSEAGSFRYKENTPEKWLNLDNVWLGWYPSNDFRFERTSVKSIDAVNKIIYVNGATSGGVKSTESGRWKVFNLLEEIDAPSEWYIDRNTMKLYYYPTYTLKDATLELAVLSENMINMTNTSYITFDGLNFEHARSNVIKMSDVIGNKITNCNFENLSYRAIDIVGTKKAETDKHWWQRQPIDGSFNCEISECVFYNIGSDGIVLEGGNVDTLTPSNNVIKNNFMNRIATKQRNASGIILRGCGNSVVNNNIGATTFHAITYYGNDHNINYNEIYNVLKCGDDVGAVYVGRNYNHRGNELSYNYLHDLIPTHVQSRGMAVGFYLDDSACGQYIHHNIIVNCNLPIYMCGQMNFYKYNTMVNSRNGMDISNNYMTESRKKTYQTSVANILNPELYFSKYKNMDIGFNDQWGAKNAFNEIVGNLNVNAEVMNIASAAYDYGVVENNLKVNTCQDFVDAKNQDYRIKSGSEINEQMPGLLDESFDIELIGTNQDIVLNSETSPFRQFYPRNGEVGVSSTDIEFMWENTYGANEFRLVVAENPELENPVYDEYLDYNMGTVPYLEEGKTYYWKVYAKNTSREFETEWESVGKPYMFTVALYNEVDTSALVKALEKAETDKLKIKENNLNGGFSEGTIKEFETLLNSGYKLVNAKIGESTQLQVDNKTEEISSFMDRKRINRPGYINLGSYIFEEEIWQSPVTITEDEVIVSGVKNNGAESLGEFTEKTIACFKAKITTENWIGMGLMASASTPIWGGGNAGYFIAVKPEFIEFQRHPGSGSSILEIADIKKANDDEWHDYEFGVIKLGASNLVTIKIDGEVVFEYLDTEYDLVTRKLGLGFYIGEGSEVRLKGQENMPEQSEFDELIKKYKDETVKDTFGKFDDTENVIMMKIGKEKILKEDNFNIEADVAPVIVNSKTLVPLRAVSETFGAEVEWENNTAIIKKDDKVIEFKPGEAHYTVNGESFEMEQGAMIMNNRMMIPVRNLAEALGKTVMWDEPNDLILIADKFGIVYMNAEDLLKRCSQTIDMMSVKY